MIAWMLVALGTYLRYRMNGRLAGTDKRPLSHKN
jgi:hypothetical protein